MSDIKTDIFKEIPPLAKPFYLATKDQAVSSDILRTSPLGKYVDSTHGLGGFFASLKSQGLLEYVGETRSIIPTNKGRKIDVFRWTSKAKETFETKNEPLEKWIK